MTGLTNSYAAWDSVITGMNQVGWAWAADTAAATCAGVTPACSRAGGSAEGFVIREPSRPTETVGLSVVSGVPPAPSTSARDGHFTLATTVSPVASCGRMEVGD